jgi:cell division protein FtsB
VAILAYFAYVAIGQQKVLNRKDAEYDEIQSKIAEETGVNGELKKELDSIDSYEYKEKIAREKLNMVKKDERVYVDIGQ